MEMVLILVPVKPRTPKEVVRKFYEWVRTAIASCEERGYSVSLVLSSDGAGDQETTQHCERAARIAQVRNQILTKHARPNKWDWICWLDADLVGSDAPTAIVRLIELSRMHNAVVAPAVFLESQQGRIPPYCKQPLNGDATPKSLVWYDTAGFVHEGKKAQARFPWAGGIKVAPGLYQVDGSVGCCFVYPGSFGAEFSAPSDPLFTEHFPMCQAAIVAGYKVLWTTQTLVYHAYLPLYGERFH